jgi:hypothetical protein
MVNYAERKGYHMFSREDAVRKRAVKTFYYTARLETSQNLLTGKYFNANDKDQKKGYPTSFVKTVNPTRK